MITSLYYSSVETFIFATACALAVSTLLYCLLTTRRSNVPNAPSAVPILGHALAFRTNPNAFFRSAQQAVGPVFRINLAGRRMIIVTSRAVMERVTAAPETSLSSQAALQEIGFDYTLGLYNLIEGTPLHRRILKSDAHAAFLKRLMTLLEYSFRTEMANNNDSIQNNGRVQIPDLFVFTRRCFLRACLVAFIGKDSENDVLMTDLMHFMDRVEDATAKAAVLPRYLAIPLVLRPVQNQRMQLQERIVTLLEPILQSNSVEGPWLDHFHFRQLPEKDQAPLAAEIVIGLVFSAHINPSVAAAQSLVYFLQSTDDNHRMQVQNEAKLQGELPSPDRTPHLYASVCEAIRLTSLSLGSIRTVCCDKFDATSEDGTVYTFQKGESVCIAHNVMDTDPLLWKDAPNYVPSRFLEKQSSLPQYMVFSRGVHKCPGERLAMSMVQIMLALFLDRNAALEGTVPALDFERATVAQRAGPVCVTLDHRENVSL